MSTRIISSRRTRRLTTTLIATALVLCAVMFAPGAAAKTKKPTGQRIDLFAGAFQTFAAGEPFHLRHGWGLGATEVPEQSGIYSFRLDVDGVASEADFVLRSTDPAPVTAYDYPLLNRGWVFNFPDGKTGTHTFTGHWIAPCGPSVDSSLYGGPCSTPNAPVEVLTRTVTVNFARTNLALGKRVTASSEYPGNPASFAVDGNWWSYWSSGDFPPAWIEVDLGSVQRVGEIDLGITQLPDCPTTHRLSGRASESELYTLLQEFNGFTVDQQVLRYSASAPQQLRFIRVDTTSSCSWVGWREIEVYATSG